MVTSVQVIPCDGQKECRLVLRKVETWEKLPTSKLVMSKFES
jgi:hypothetical protein